MSADEDDDAFDQAEEFGKDDGVGEDLFYDPYDGVLALPDGSEVCLCGRGLDADDVGRELTKACAVLGYLDIRVDDCLGNVAALYDRLEKDLRGRFVRDLRRRRREFANFFREFGELMEDLAGKKMN